MVHGIVTDASDDANDDDSDCDGNRERRKAEDVM